jgi:uncharacterized protein YyaL (SSP411 family)
MKKFLYSIGLILLFTSNIIAQNFSQAPELPSVNWLSWDEGYTHAQNNEKVIMIDLYTEWCGWCKKMDKETFKNAEVVEIINMHFVPVKMNPEKNGQSFLYKGQKVNAKQLLKLIADDNQLKYPSIVFYYPEHNEVFTEEGFQKPKSFKHLLKIYVNHNEKLNAKAQK